MDAEKYLIEKNRMIKDCSISCSGCPLSGINNGFNKPYHNMEKLHPKEAVAIVEQWAKEHPVKTYKSVFLERFPNAETDYDGELFACVRHVFGSEHAFHGDCDDETACEVCWNREVEE